MFESPITQILSEMQTEYENGVLKAVQNVGFHVDKEELEKALAYDRGQYDKGYADGLNADRWIPCSERLPKEKGTYLVTVKNFGVTFGRFTGQKDNLHFDSNVIAWQPLPAPYIIEESEE